MTHTHEHEAHTLVAPYALHAVPPTDVQRFEAHLARCPSCRDEIEEIRDVAARLGTAEAVAPPNEFTAHVLSKIATVRPLRPARGRFGNARTASVDRASLRRWWPRVSVAAAAALIVAVGVLASTLSDANRRFDAAEQFSAQLQRVAAASDMRQSSEGAARGEAVVMSSRSADTALVMPALLDAVPDDRVYEAWLMNGDDVRAAGLLRNDDGRTQPVAIRNLDEATKVGITVEPEGGSDLPTTDPVLLVDLPR